MPFKSTRLVNAGDCIFFFDSNEIIFQIRLKAFLNTASLNERHLQFYTAAVNVQLQLKPLLPNIFK